MKTKILDTISFVMPGHEEIGRVVVHVVDIQSPKQHKTPAYPPSHLFDFEKLNVRILKTPSRAYISFDQLAWLDLDEIAREGESQAFDNFDTSRSLDGILPSGINWLLIKNLSGFVSATVALLS